MRGKEIFTRLPHYFRVIVLILLIFLLSVLVFSDYAEKNIGRILGVRITAVANCYWVGDTPTANWDDATHWASSAGGTPSTCDGGLVPQSDDTVYFTSDNTNSADINAVVSVAGFIIQSG